jgi:15-cis-phytoene synthase
MRDAFAYCAELVRASDHDRFIAALFAPSERRDALNALYAFNVEVARVREAAHAALPGEIRLQWWSDVISRQRDEEARANPLAAALLTTMERHNLNPSILLDLIEARRFDLYEEPMATVADLETFTRRTSSSLFALAGQILVDANAAAIAEPAGIAYGITAILRAFPVHIARRQLYLPTELLDRHRVNMGDLFAGRPATGLAAAVAELRELARTHLGILRERLEFLPPLAVPAFLPLALVGPSLAKMQRGDPLRPAEIAPWRRQWLIWRAARNPVRIAAC